MPAVSSVTLNWYAVLTGPSFLPSKIKRTQPGRCTFSRNVIGSLSLSRHAPYGWDFGPDGKQVENSREQQGIKLIR
jgi:hypothetical protein